MTRLVRRRALLIGNERYEDSRFGPLPSTQADVWQLRQVLEHRNIGAFTSVSILTDLAADDMRQAISEFLAGCAQDELALLYVSGHGARVSRAGGEFHFVATDTDFDRIADTGVAAGFVNERLEECWAPQKIVMIDCCRSGGFAVGLRTSDVPPGAVAKSGEQAPITSKGVYVLSSSRAGEDSYADPPAGGEVIPSVFTAEVVEALRTGRVGKDGTGEVSVDDLFQYVNRRMRAQQRQVPVKSSHGVDDTIIVASCPLGSAPLLVPLSRRPVEQRPVPEPSQVPKAAGKRPTWEALLAYYRDCVLADDTEAPLMRVDEHGISYVCLSGPERFLSGDVDEDDCVALPAQAAQLLDSAEEQNAELWAGYPAVVLNGPRNRAPWKTPRFAPLLIRRVEFVHGDDGIRLRPYGPVVPHPRLARDWLGEEEAAQLSETYQPTWHRGQHDRMAVDARNLLMQDFELPCVQELRPDQLAERIDIQTPGHGARNAAVLFTAPADTQATKKLLEDLDALADRVDSIGSTALAALSPDPQQRALALPLTEPQPDTLVTPLPCNEGQEAVLRSAMTRRLTVATGPPGTGKTQLVADVVATAIASGQSVLVASTNNEAVDEVWRRCEQLVPGSVVRTGSAWARTMDYAEAEAAALRFLSSVEAPGSNVATSTVNVAVSADRLARLRRALEDAATAEHRLLRAGEARERHAAELQITVAELVGKLTATPRLDQLVYRAGQLGVVRFLGNWRRTRFLSRMGIAAPSLSSAEACRALAEAATAQATWIAARETAVRVDDAALSEALTAAEQDLQAASRALLESVVRTNARTGRQRIMALLTARDRVRSDWPAVKNVLPAAPAWAVTSLSARRFPPEAGLFDLVILDEASQCAIPHVLPLLFRARRALVIGDAMQLPHIAKTGPEREGLIRRTHGLDADWLEKHRLAYRRHSAFHAAERAAGGSLLLDQHFRCHPQIAEFSNGFFYDGGLTVLTDTRNRQSLPRPALLWRNVAGRATRARDGSSWVNTQEIAVADQSVRYLLEQLPLEATIGVVTPFRGQAEELRRRLAHHDQERVRIGTVHTFQGGERDVVIFSLVAGDGMRSSAVSWVEGQLNLWNVAITRARSHLVVIGDETLWRERGGVAAALRSAAEADPTGSSGSRTPDELLKRLYEQLSNQPGASVILGENVNGHPADAVVRVDNGPASVLILDRGPEADADAAAHLRVMLHRRRLLGSGEPDGAAIRLSAWRLYETAPD